MTTPLPDPAPEPGSGAHLYTTGETAALIAPLVGTEPENVAAYAILVAGKDGQLYKCRPEPMTPAMFVSFLLQGAALEGIQLEAACRTLQDRLGKYEPPGEPGGS